MKLSAKEQRARFESASRESGCDESPEAFERVFAKVVPPKVATASDKGRPGRKKPSR